MPSTIIAEAGAFCTLLTYPLLNGMVSFSNRSISPLITKSNFSGSFQFGYSRSKYSSNVLISSNACRINEVVVGPKIPDTRFFLASVSPVRNKCKYRDTSRLTFGQTTSATLMSGFVSSIRLGAPGSL